MAVKRALLLISFLLCTLVFIAPHSTFSADLPEATRKILKKGKMDPAILADIDSELQVPKKWIEGAKKEGNLRILSTLDPRQAKAIFKPFKERYPFISIEYSRASGPIRRIKTLTALKQGRLVTDILTGVGGSYFLYREANGLEDLRDIPNWKNNPEGTKDPDGFWVGMHLRYWCMGYNTELVKKEDLPKKWEDLLTNPRWRNKNLALGNRAQLWALMLWKAKGEEWTKNFLTKLFTEVKPQLRKEGMNAMLGLTIVGEFHGNIPAGGYRALQKVKLGAPMGWTCPEPVPVAVSEMTVLRGSPNINSAKLFINWFLSKEGQIAQYVTNFAPPVHKDLRGKQYLPFPDAIIGKKISFRDPGMEVDLQPKVLKFWNELWLAGGGEPRERR